MTVAAIVLVPDSAAASADAGGDPVIRRLVHAAWVGRSDAHRDRCRGHGRASSGCRSRHACDADRPYCRPAARHSLVRERSASGTRRRNRDVGRPAVAGPPRLVDPETVTSLVEAHGAMPDAIVWPAYAGQTGFPILVPATLIERLAGHLGLNGADAVTALIAEGVPVRVVELATRASSTTRLRPMPACPATRGLPSPLPNRRRNRTRIQKVGRPGSASSRTPVPS